MKRLPFWIVVVGLSLSLFACHSAETPTPPPPPTQPAAATPVALAPTAVPSPTATHTLVPSLTPEPPTATPSPSPTPTPGPYHGLSIDELRARTYGGGQIETRQVMAQNDVFTRYLVRFPSDGIQVGGFMNVPKGDAPFPVVIVNHGYVNPNTYQTLAYTTRYADALARAGYLTIHPNYRNHVGSEQGSNVFRTGYAIDVLNLVQLAKKLPQAKPDAIGMFGHSMGGGITLRVLTITPDVKAAVVYGSMSGDEADNYRAIMRWTGGGAGRSAELPAPPEAEPEVYRQISPINFLEYVTAPVSIHHGDADPTVPPAWSVRLRDSLKDANKEVEYFNYPGQPHSFVGEGYNTFLRRVISFFDRHLKGK